MIMRLVSIFILLLASVFLGILLQQDPGYLLIEVRHWRIEMTLVVAIIAIVILFIMLHSFLTLQHWLANLPSAYRNWKEKRRLYKARSITKQGLIEFSEGDWLAAKTHLTKALPDSETPLLNYLTAAKAAQELGNIQLRDEYLQAAQLSIPESTITVELTKAQLQLDNHQWDQALITLKHLKTLAPSHPLVLKLLMQLYQAVNDWPELLKLLPKLKKSKLISINEYESLEKSGYLKMLIDLTTSSQASLELSEFFASLPKKLSYDPELTYYYAEFLIKHQEYSLAEVTLRRALKKEFNEKLILLYSDFFVNKKQLSFAENFLKEHEFSAALYLSLGKLCKASLLWGKAKDYLEKSLSLEQNSETYAEMGKLYDFLGEQDQALVAYREGSKLLERR